MARCEVSRTPTVILEDLGLGVSSLKLRARNLQGLGFSVDVIIRLAYCESGRGLILDSARLRWYF